MKDESDLGPWKANCPKILGELLGVEVQSLFDVVSLGVVTQE